MGSSLGLVKMEAVCNTGKAAEKTPANRSAGLEYPLATRAGTGEGPETV